MTVEADVADGIPASKAGEILLDLGYGNEGLHRVGADDGQDGLAGPEP